MDCTHEWVKLNKEDLNVDPPKVHIKCRLCRSETFELTSEWERRLATPKLALRVERLEEQVTMLIVQLEELIQIAKPKPSKSKKKED